MENNASMNMADPNGATDMARASQANENAQPAWPHYEDDEIAAVLEILRSGRVNALVHGNENRAFEQEFAAFCDVPHAVAVANGTLALELALRATGIGPGDEVIIPARSFFATASCVVAVGATPVFADILIDSQTIDPESVETLISPKCRAVICVHLAGWPCDMDALTDICNRHNLVLIEDCAQAHGASYRGQMVGSFGDMAAFSFCTDKIISTGGEGGMLTMKDIALRDRAWAYKDHGKNPNRLKAPPGSTGFRYLHDSFGSNYRLTEMQAAIGRRQLAKLPLWIERRRNNAAILADELRKHPAIIVPDMPNHVGHAYYKFYARLNPEKMRADFDIGQLLQPLVRENMPVGTGSCPDMSREQAFAGTMPRGAEALRVAPILGRSTIMMACDHLRCPDDLRHMARSVIRRLDETGIGR